MSTTKYESVSRYENTKKCAHVTFVFSHLFVLRRSSCLPHYSSQRGQGLLELVVALGILVTGMAVTLTLALANTVANREAADRAIAANLAREGIEVVEHIRFSNIDLGQSWDQNLAAGMYVALLDLNGTPPWTLATLTGANQELMFQDDGASSLFGMRLQGATTGQPTGFMRTITIADICEDGSASCDASASPPNPKVGIRVRSKIEWKGGGRRTVEAEEMMYHWQ